MQLFKRLNVIIFILSITILNLTDAQAAARPETKKSDFVVDVKRTKISIDDQKITCVAKLTNKRLLIGTATGKLFLYKVDDEEARSIKTDLRAEKIHAVMLYGKYFVVSYSTLEDTKQVDNIALIEVPSGEVSISSPVMTKWGPINQFFEYNDHIIAGHANGVVTTWLSGSPMGYELCNLKLPYDLKGHDEVYAFRNNKDRFEILQVGIYCHSSMRHFDALSYEGNEKFTPVTIQKPLIYPMGFKYMLNVGQKRDVIVHEDEPEKVVALVGTCQDDDDISDKIIRVIPLDSGRVVVEKTYCGCLSESTWELLQLTFDDREEALLNDFKTVLTFKDKHVHHRCCRGKRAEPEAVL